MTREDTNRWPTKKYQAAEERTLELLAITHSFLFHGKIIETIQDFHELFEPQRRIASVQRTRGPEFNREMHTKFLV
jgi:hypothetical protein